MSQAYSISLARTRSPRTARTRLPARSPLKAGSYTSAVNGVPVTINFQAVGPTSGTMASATVTQGTLAVSAFPIVGTEGNPIAAGPIATFIDAGGADPVVDYSATISVYDSGGALTLSVPAASITQIGNWSQFAVNAPQITLPEEGTYQVVVAVTDSGGTTPITVDGVSMAVIADAALVPGPETLLTAHTGIAPPDTEVVATFTDSNALAVATEFTASIDWGDGSPQSSGIVYTTSTPGRFQRRGRSHLCQPGRLHDDRDRR